MATLKARLGVVGEVLLGGGWWLATYAWGGVITAILVLAPLLLGNMVAEIIDALPATAAVASGIIGAYALGLPPWDGDEPLNLALIIGGAAISSVAWDLMRDHADVVTLLVALALAIVGWPIRRVLNRRFGSE